MRNYDNPLAMDIQKIGTHTVQMYAAIDELPIARYHVYQKYLMIDAGIGADIAAFDTRTEKLRRYLLTEQCTKARAELDNLRQCLYFMQTGLAPKHRAFAALVHSIDGVPCDDLSDEGLQRVCDTLGDVPVGWLLRVLEAVKKKIDAELVTYFPRLFEAPETKEYFDLLRARALKVLDNIVAGNGEPDRTPEVEKLTTALMTYTPPKVFTGSEGEEVRFDRNFDDLCAVVSGELNRDARGMTVREFYGAYELLQARQREMKKSGKR